MIQLYNANYVAGYLGVSRQSMNKWIRTPSMKFPEPDGEVIGLSETTNTYVWANSRLPLLRAWLATRRGYTAKQAAAHWKDVDQRRQQALADGPKG